MKIFVTNFKNKFTGVTTTAFTVARAHVEIFDQDVTIVGNVLGDQVLPSISSRQLLGRWDQLVGDESVVLHVRRDSEMLFGLWLRDVQRKPIKLVFTSANMTRRSWIGRLLMARMDAVIATTQAAGAVLPVEPSAIIPHGVDLEQFRPSLSPKTQKSRRTLACVGRVREGKGTHRFVNAFIKVARQRDDVDAIAFGMIKPEDAVFHRRLLRQLEQAGLSDRFTWAGEVHHADLVERLGVCDVLVALPAYEPFGVTPIEAMAMGIPSVCSYTGCFVDLIKPGQNGYLVAHDDEVAAAEAIAKALTLPLGKAEFVHKLRDDINQRFSQKAEAEAILGIYRQLSGRYDDSAFNRPSSTSRSTS